MRGINRVRLPAVRYRQIRRLTGLSVRCLVVAAILLIGCCPELLEMFPHRHLGVVAAGHDATPLEALEHLLHYETESAHHHSHGHHQEGVSLVSPSHGSLLGLSILIPSWLTLVFISILIAELRLPVREAFAGCSWPPLSPPPRTTV